jgi:hypothetical protein
MSFRMIMPSLPGSGFTVLFVCGLGLALVAIFAVKEFRFTFHYRRGTQLFNEGNYQAALRHLIQAEKLWMLRLSKQTMPSRAEDCRNLVKVLELISEAAGHYSLEIEMVEYRKAANEMERFFSIEKGPSRDYAQICSTFAELRKQFRDCSSKVLCKTSLPS